jgi:hypothetical protein
MALLALTVLVGLVSVRRRVGWLLAAIVPVVVWVACGGGGGGGTSAPFATVYPSSLSFGNQNLNSTSSTQTVTVSHTGSSSLIIYSSIIGGADGQDFQEWVNCGYNAALGPGVTCPIVVAFTPTAIGPRNATITIADNAGNNPQIVSLNGSGVQPPTPPGSYGVFVTATSGPDTHGQTITVNVQ